MSVMVKQCPRPLCGKVAVGEAEIEKLFGFRHMRPGADPVPQSNCRTCRADHAKERRQLVKLGQVMVDEGLAVLPKPVPAHVDLPPLRLSKPITYRGQGVHSVGQLCLMGDGVYIVEPSGALRFVRKIGE